MYSGIRLLHLSITYKLGSSKPKWHGSKSTNQNQQTRAFKLVEVNCSLLRGPLWWLMQQNTKQVIEQSSHFLERLCTITLQKWDNYFFCVWQSQERFLSWGLATFQSGITKSTALRNSFYWLSYFIRISNEKGTFTTIIGDTKKSRMTACLILYGFVKCSVQKLQGLFS